MFDFDIKYVKLRFWKRVNDKIMNKAYNQFLHIKCKHYTVLSDNE